ncbi:MAG: hypothetical protein ACKVU1_04735 [bacterium]
MPRSILLFAATSAVALAIWAHVANGLMPIVVDESVYIWQARQLAAGHLTGPAPQHPEFVNVPFLPIREGRRFAQYPIGYPLALAPWVALGIPWALNVLLAVASLIMLFLFVRALDGDAIAWLATALMASSPFFITQSTTFMSHPIQLALTLVALLALERRESGAPRVVCAAVCGAAIGFVFNVSPFTAGGIGLVALDRLIATRRTCRARPAEVIACAALVLGGVGVFALVNTLETGSPLVPAYYYTDPSVRAGFGEEFGGKQGHSPARALLMTQQRVKQLGEFLFGWPLTSYWPAALYVCWRIAARIQKRRASATTMDHRGAWDSTFAVLFAGTVVIYAFWYFHGTGRSWGPRYLYTTVPALVVPTARGLVLVARAVSGIVARNSPLRTRSIALLPWALALVLFLTGTIAFLSGIYAHDVTRTRRVARELLDRLHADGIERATIFVTSQDKKGLFQQNRLLALSDYSETAAVVFARDEGTDANRAFVDFRGGGPAYRIAVRDDSFDWQVEPYGAIEKPYRIPRAPQAP